MLTTSLVDFPSWNNSKIFHVRLLVRLHAQRWEQNLALLSHALVPGPTRPVHFVMAQGLVYLGLGTWGRRISVQSTMAPPDLHPWRLGLLQEEGVDLLIQGVRGQTKGSQGDHQLLVAH